LVEAAAKRYNLDPDLVTSVIAVESNFDPKAVSRKNAHGLMQLLPETAAQLGVKNIDDPAENIDAGSRYLKYLLQMYNGNLSLALAAYNAGPVKVQLYGSVPPYAETISYVRRVKRGYDKSKTETSKKTPAANALAPRTPASPAAGLGTAPAFSPLAPGPGTAPPSSAAASGARTVPASSPPPTGQPQ
jgi:soluble lytic murein transglycosylase-like protein